MSKWTSEQVRLVCDEYFRQLSLAGIKSPGIMYIAQMQEALATLDQPQPEVGGVVAYFSSDPAEGAFNTHKSLAEAITGAEQLLAFAQDAASDDGWADEPPQICYGVVLGGCVEKEGSRRPAPEGRDFTEVVDFELIARKPEPADAVSDVDVEKAFLCAGGKWDGDRWVIEDADLHPFVRSIAARHARGAVSDDIVTIGSTRCYGDAWFREITAGGVRFLAPLDDQEKARHVLAARHARGVPDGDWLSVRHVVEWMEVFDSDSPALDILTAAMPTTTKDADHE